MRVKIFNEESARERLEEARLRRKAITDDFERALDEELIVFEFDKDNTDEDEQLGDYKGAATDGLAAILAEAGRAEAEAKRMAAKANKK